MSTPPGLAGKWKDVVKKNIEHWPYLFDSYHKPSNHFGRDCRIVPILPQDHIPKGQGFVMIEFKGQSGRYCVLRGKLLKK